MGFLTKILSAIALPIFEWGYEKISSAIENWLKRRAVKKQAKEAADNSVKDLKSATTAKEIDEATDKALDDF